MRQERRETLRKENGWIYRFVKWTKSRTNQQDVHQQDVQPPPAIPSVETERTDSSTSLSSGSDDEIILDQDTSSSTELNEGDTGGDGIDDHVEESSAENNVWSSPSPISTSNIVGIRNNDINQEMTNGRE